MKINEGITNIILSIISCGIYDALPNLKKKDVKAEFCAKLEEKLKEFSGKRDGTIVTSNSFINYIKHYSVIDRIVEYVFLQKPEMVEESFLSGMIKEFEDSYYSAKGATLPPLEYSAFREFCQILLTCIKEQLYETLDDNNRVLLYEMRQTRMDVQSMYAENRQSHEEQGHALEEIKKAVQRVEKYVEPRSEVGYADSEDSEQEQVSGDGNGEAEFSCPEKYISRKVRHIGEDFASKNSIMTLEELVQTENRVTLLGEAGIGKSWELRYLAHRLEATGGYKVVWIPLEDYVDETIEELAGFSGTEHKKCVLIFDGYDEIQEQNLGTFARRLNGFVKKRPSQKIVVSSRNNFYRAAIEKDDVSTFRDFYECVLEDLKENDIREYLAQRDIDVDDFMEEVQTKKLTDLLKSPFFLTKMIDLYVVDEKLPALEQLMDRLIYISLEQDTRKYITTKESIEDQKLEIIKNLRMISFAMQCMKKQKMEEMEYQELCSGNVRELLKYCGIWKRTADRKWEFDHNNFREYLTACFLKDLPMEEIIRLVTYEDGRNLIKLSWVNVLSFLFLIYEDQSFKEWVIENEPSVIVRFETGRLDEERRTKIFCNILEEYKKKNMWISQGRSNLSDLAKFGQTVECIEYLMKEVREPLHFRAQSNAIVLLGEMTDFAGKEAEVREVLLACCLGTAVRNHEVRMAVMSLRNRVLYEESVITVLTERFIEEKDSDIWEAILSYIREYHLQEGMADDVVRRMQICRDHEEETEIEVYRVEELLQEMRSYEAIHKVIASLVEDTDLYSTWNLFRDGIRVLLIHAQEVYDKGDLRIVENLQALFIKASKEWERGLESEVKQCLEHMESIFQTYELVWECVPKDDMLYTLEAIMDEECIDDLADRYRRQCPEAMQVFAEYVARLYKGDYRYDEFRKLILETEGREIKEQEKIDYQKKEEEKTRKKFEVLFNELDNRAIQKDIFLVKCHGILQNNNFIQISEEQKKVLIKACRQVMEEIDFDKEAIWNKDGTERYSYRALSCLWFTGHFSISYEEELMRKLIFFSSHIFGEEYREMGTFAQYVVKNISEEEIRKQILNNLKEEVLLYGNKAEKHLKYCGDNGLMDAMGLADRILLDVEYGGSTQRMAGEYLLKVKGPEYVIEKYLDSANQELLKWMSRSMEQTKDERLIARLVKENTSAENRLHYLKELIHMKPETGLAIYCQLAEELNTLPDGGAENEIADVTEEIAEVSDKECLDQSAGSGRTVEQRRFSR